MIGYFLTLVLYLIPILLIHFMVIEIRFHNKCNKLNRVASFLSMAMLALLLGLLLVNMVPMPYVKPFIMLFIYIPAFCIMGIGLHFLNKLTPRFRSWPLYKLIGTCYFPLLAIPYILGCIIIEHYDLDIKLEGFWLAQYPHSTLFGVLIIAVFYTVMMSFYFMFAGKRYISREMTDDKKSKQFNLILWGVLFAGVWAGVGSMLKNANPFGLPISSYPILILVGFIRVAMLRYGFLPTIERKYKILYDMSPLPILLLSGDGGIRDGNRAASSLLGINVGLIKKQSILSFLKGNDWNRFQAAFQLEVPFNGEFELHTSKGEAKVVRMKSEFIQSDGEQLQYVILTDITETKLAEEHIRYLAYHDALTGLANRRLFQEKLTGLLKQAELSCSSVIVMLLDLDRFKQINDTKGHHVGDLLLQHISSQLQIYSEEAKIIARLGGDEFALLFTGLEDEEVIRHIAEKLFNGFEEPFKYGDEFFRITASMGICISPKHGTNPDILLQYADIAMYEAKSNGRSGFGFYNQHNNV